MCRVTILSDSDTVTLECQDVQRRRSYIHDVSVLSAAGTLSVTCRCSEVAFVSSHFDSRLVLE